MELQDRVDSYEGTEKHELILMLVQAEDEIDDLRARIAELERCVVMARDMVYSSVDSVPEGDKE